MEHVRSNAKIISFGASDTGKKRQNNEDSFLVNEELSLFVVADGVGGSEGGEVASRIAVETLAASLPEMLAKKDPEESDPEVALRSAVALANRAIRGERLRRPMLADMGTTLTALLLNEGRAHLIHIGDSRAYLVSSGELSQVSADHTLVAEQVRAGLLTPSEAHTSPYRHVITRALGSIEEVVPETTMHMIREGDIFLLCTDGLTDMVTDQEIEKILTMNAPREAVQGLIDAANRGGGVDNITAVVVQVIST